MRFFNHYLGFYFFQQRLKIVVDNNLQNLYYYSLGNKASILAIKRRLEGRHGHYETYLILFQRNNILETIFLIQR